MNPFRTIVIALGLMLGGPAFAQAPPDAPPTHSRTAGGVEDAENKAPVSGPIGVELMCVLGTNSNDRIDPELKPIVRQLAFTRYTGFDLVDSHEQTLAVGEEATFTIEGDRKVKIELIDRDATEAKLRVRLFNPEGKQLVDTTVSVHRNRSFIVAGPKVGEDVLILPITVEY